MISIEQTTRLIKIEESNSKDQSNAKGLNRNHSVQNLEVKLKRRDNENATGNDHPIQMSHKDFVPSKKLGSNVNVGGGFNQHLKLSSDDRNQDINRNQLMNFKSKFINKIKMGQTLTSERKETIRSGSDQVSNSDPLQTLNTNFVQFLEEFKLERNRESLLKSNELQSNLRKARNEEQMRESQLNWQQPLFSYQQDLKSLLKDHPNGMMGRQHSKRVEATILMEWIKHQTQIVTQNLLEAKNEDKLRLCQNFSEIGKVAMSQVIREYSKPACSEWADILQQIQEMHEQNVEQIKMLYQEEIEQLHCQCHHDLQQSIQKQEEIKCDHEQELKRIDDEMRQLQELLQEKEHKINVYQQERDKSLEANMELRNEIVSLSKKLFQKDEKIAELELNIFVVQKKEEQIQKELNKNTFLNEELETELIRLQTNKVSTSYNINDFKAKLDKKVAKQNDSESSSGNDDEPIPKNSMSTEQAQQLEINADMLSYFNQNDAQVQKFKKQLPTEKEIRQYIQSQNKSGIKLDPLNLLDNQEEDILLSDEENNTSMQDVKALLERQERRYILQGKFISKFLMELESNQHFDELQNYVQNRLLNDEFLLRIISNKHSTVKHGKSPNKKQSNKATTKQTVEQKADKDAQSRVLENFQVEYAHLKAYITPILNSDFLKTLANKGSFKMTIENLFEIIFSVLGQMFLTKSDQISSLMTALKMRFPLQAKIMSDTYVNQSQVQKQTTASNISLGSDANNGNQHLNYINIQLPQSQRELRRNSIVTQSDQVLQYNRSAEFSGSKKVLMSNHPIQMYSQATQTGETMDELILLASIQGLNLNGVSGEKNFVLHDFDMKTNKLTKLKIKKATRKDQYVIQAQEYLPKDVVERFLPFNCMMRLEKNMQQPVANLTFYELNKESLRDGGENVTEIQLNPLPMLQGYAKPKQAQNTGKAFLDTKLRKQTSVLSATEVREALNTFFSVMKEVSSQYLLPQKLNIEQILEDAETKQNKYLELPPFLQQYLQEMIQQKVAYSLNISQQLKNETKQRIQDIQKAELTLNQLNEKVLAMNNHIQELQIQLNLLNNRDSVREFHKLVNIPQNAKYLPKVMLMLTQHHTNGFKLGVTYGKLLGQQMMSSLLVQQAQLKGTKYGYVCGYRSGQINGISRVIQEAYLHGINLLLPLEGKQILEEIDQEQLKRDCLNQYEKTFKQLNVDQSSIQKARDLVNKFKELPVNVKLMHKKLTLKGILKFLHIIYIEKHAQLSQNKNLTLIEVIMNHHVFNFGKNVVTESRIFKLFASTMFLMSLEEEEENNIRDVELYVMDNKKLGSGKKRDGESRNVNLQLIHFIKFCQISNNLNNFSKEILNFYVKVYKMCKDDHFYQTPIFNAAMENYYVDAVSLTKVLNSLSLFEECLPEKVLFGFKMHVQQGLIIQLGGTSYKQEYVDFDRYIDQALLLYLRYNKVADDQLSMLYYAWTLFSVDSIDFDQIYLLMKLMAPRDTKNITFKYQNGGEQDFVTKNIKQVMEMIHTKFGTTSKHVLTKGSLAFDQDDLHFLNEHNRNENLGNQEQVPPSLKIITDLRDQQTKFKERRNITLSKEHFCQILKDCQLLETSQAKNIIMSARSLSQLPDYQDEDTLISKQFVTQCNQRMNLLRQKFQELENLTRRAVFIQQKCMIENNIDPRSGQKHYQDSTSFGTSNPDNWQTYQKSKFLELKKRYSLMTPQSFESEGGTSINSLHSSQKEKKEVLLQDPTLEVKTAKMNREQKEMYDLMNKELYDIKQYSNSLEEWENRINRLEMRINNLSPMLTSLSFELYERSIQLLIIKQQNFVEKQYFTLQNNTW